MSRASFTDNTDKLYKSLQNNMEDTFLDILLDLKRTSSESAPHLTGNLEKSFTYSMQNSGDALVGTVSVSAMDGSVDYAEIMHNSDYKLGKQSQKKPGGKSAYGGGRVKVGKGYLTNAMTYAEDGYLEAMQKSISDSVDKYSD